MSDTLTCPVCGETVQRLHPTQRIWHGKCPLRNKRTGPPEFILIESGPPSGDPR